MWLMKQAYLVKFQMLVLIFILTLFWLLLMYPENREEHAAKQLRRGEPYTIKTSVL